MKPKVKICCIQDAAEARLALAAGADALGFVSAMPSGPGPISEALIAELEIPSRLSHIGVRKEDIPLLAEMAQNDLCMLTNPYCYPKEEIEALYLEAW